MPKRYEGMAYWEIVSRQMGILNKKEQLKLKESKITVIGCGGIGGAVLDMLARMGVGCLRIVDKDSFDISNINRQMMSSFYNVGKSKIMVTEETLRSINPFLEVEAIEKELNSHNVGKILKGSDLVVDALDNLLSRIIVSRYASKIGISFVHGAVHGTMGQVTIFAPDTPTYEELFKMPSSGKNLTERVVEQVKKLNKDTPPVIASVPNIVGCLEAFEVLKLITGLGKPIISPKVLFFDLFKDEPFSIVNFSI